MSKNHYDGSEIVPKNNCKFDNIYMAMGETVEKLLHREPKTKP